MRLLNSFVLHKKTRSVPISQHELPKSVVIDRAYNDLFAPENPSLNSPRCRDIDLENVHLKRLSSTWALSHSRLVYDLNLTQSELLLERERNKRLRERLSTHLEHIERLEQSLAGHKRLTSALGEIGLSDSVVTRAHVLVSEGQNSTDALVKSVKEATAVPGNDWSVSIPAVSGPRTQTEYIAALHLSLDARKELRKCKKITKFWKRLAQQQSELYSGTVTPSASVLSSVYEKLSPERQDAVKALIERREQDGRKNMLYGGGLAHLTSEQILPDSLVGHRVGERTAKGALCSVATENLEHLRGSEVGLHSNKSLGSVTYYLEVTYSEFYR
ncbi:hypothetical protein AX15_006130 [Amanita polypyramis BW_CC]|nr:hypothetical protein AX15_006130 [Amanita polypyramis BW_CC]